MKKLAWALLTIVVAVYCTACATAPDGFGTQTIDHVEAATVLIAGLTQQELTPERERIKIASTVAAASYLASRSAGLDKNVSVIGAWHAVVKMSKLMSIDMADLVRAQIPAVVPYSDAEIYTALIRAGLTPAKT